MTQSKDSGMDMSVIGLAVLFGLVVCALAYRANLRFRGEDRLPMQWSLTGEVTWSAPRRLALAFIPGAAILVLGIFVVLAHTLQPRAGQEAQVLPTFAGVGTIFVAIQGIHVWLIAKTLRRKVR